MNKTRIPYSEKMKQELEELLIKGKAMEVAHPLDAFLRQGARFMIQKALETEMEEFLGRGHYRRGERKQEGMRNGYEAHHFKTPMGVLTVGKPQVRETEEAFSSKLLERLNSDHGDALSKLALGMYVRGMSHRDVEDIWQEVFGRQVLSKSASSELSKQLEEEFGVWRERDLSSIKPLYLFLDGIFLAVRQGTTEKEGVLAAYCITDEGKKVLLHLSLGSRESYQDWLSFLQDMVSRGLKEPLLVISDGRPGLIKAAKEMWPRSFKQRCQVHKMRNILSKLPKCAIKQMKSLVSSIFRARSFEEGMRLGREIIDRFRDLYPSAMECLEKDLEECLTCLRFPKEHGRFIRTTNLMERTFGEARRRTKVIPRFPGEQSCLSLVFATLIRASQKWHGVRMTPKAIQELEILRHQGRKSRSQDMQDTEIVRPRPNASEKIFTSALDLEKSHANGAVAVTQ